MRQDHRRTRTVGALRNALAELVREKPYPEIVVKEILARADVGRSTFYTHFGDKDELLVSCIHEMLGAATPAARRREGPLWFSLPFFSHIEEHGLRDGRVHGPTDQRALHAQLRSAIEELVEAGLEGRSPRPGIPEQGGLLAGWIAGTFVAVLEWWVQSPTPVPALEVDRIFRQLVAPALA